MTTNGPPVKIQVECHQGPGGSQIDNTSTLVAGASGAPAIATLAVTGARELTVTPGGSAGSLSIFASESPSADKNLEVRLQVDPTPAVREIVYVSHA